MQPLNGRLLVKVATNGEYKHVNLGTDKQYENAGSTGVVIAVSADLEAIVREGLKLGDTWLNGLIKPTELLGKTIRWEKHAEQNSLHKAIDPKTKQEYQAALIHYKDIVAYES